MPATSHSQFPLVILCAFSLLLISGCQNEDADFHTYREPDPVQTPDHPDSAKPLPSASGVVTASAESIQSPLKLPASIPPQSSLPAPYEANSGTPGPISIGAALPSPAVAPSRTPTPTSPAPPELALSFPPAPPAAVALESLTSKPATSLLPARKMQLLIPEKTFKVEGPEGAIRVSFDDVDLLKVLNVDPVPVDIEKDLPSWLSGLHGKTVRIRGWMFPPDFESGLKGFLFVRDNEICCFGRKPLVYDKFPVKMRPGVTTHYISGRPFDVVGRMVVKSRIEAGELFWLYLIEDAVVISK